MSRKFLSGDEALAEGVRLARPQVISAYPITPQTVVVERLSEMVESGALQAEYLHVESEHSALSAAMGASATGARAFTATSSQGLLYMAEVLTYAAGGRFPLVMMNANRATALPWNIYGDQRDSLALLDHGTVVSVERDSDLLPVLAETTAFHSDRYRVINEDALKVGRSQLEEAYAALGAPLPGMLVANLPYAVAATVILDWFQRFEFLQSMTVMVQSEVADRIAAEKGCKDYGAYTVKLRMYARTAGRFQVSPRCFHPAPRVESAVIRLERSQLCEDAGVVEAACTLADAAFAQRRKNIRNSMRTRLDAGLVDQLLESCGIAPTLRGEALDVEDYLRMARVMLELQA